MYRRGYRRDDVHIVSITWRKHRLYHTAETSTLTHGGTHETTSLPNAIPKPNTKPKNKTRHRHATQM